MVVVSDRAGRCSRKTPVLVPQCSNGRLCRSYSRRMAHDGTEKRNLAAIMVTETVSYAALSQRKEVSLHG